MSQPKVHSLQISGGGVPKFSVPIAKVTFAGVEGDKQKDLRYHGGAKRAVCLFSLDVIEMLQKEGHPIAPGTTGENITIANLDWTLLGAGVTLQIGPSVILQITADAPPCPTIARSFTNGEYKRIAYKKFPAETRWYARVSREGEIRPGDGVSVLQRPPGQTIFNYD